MFWKRNKEWLIVCIFLLIFGSVYYFGVRLIQAHIVSQKRVIREIETSQKRDSERIGQLPQLRQDYQFADESEGRIPSFLDKGQIVDIYRELDLLGEQTGNRIEYEVVDPPDFGSAKSKNAPKDGAVIGNSLPVKDIIQLKIMVEGDYSGLINFISKLENERYFMDILAVDISSIEKQNDNQSRRRTISVQTEPTENQELPQNQLESTLNVVVYIKS